MTNAPSPASPELDDVLARHDHDPTRLLQILIDAAVSAGLLAQNSSV